MRRSCLLVGAFAGVRMPSRANASGLTMLVLRWLSLTHSEFVLVWGLDIANVVAD